ncbi:MAG: ABC transporter ATP-binding protein [Actinomycetota bacterium]|nr:ABC transporter ATP-binding protein [Actinomycetota bacterium]
MSGDPVLEVRGVHKAFGAREVLHGIDLDVAAGEIVAVLGPSGCGKTTLLRLIAGFERLDAGSIAVNGIEVAGSQHCVPPERRQVGVVPQEGALFPHLDVARNIGYGLHKGPEATARVHEMLELVGLAGRGEQRPNELSGGQQQRVALARALAPRPSLVLLDEPFSSLDAAMRAQVRDEVFDVLRTAGATAILVTHDQQEALSVADRVAVMLDGRIAQFGDPDVLYERPTSLEVARFVGDAVLLPGTLTGDAATCSLGELALRGDHPPSGPVVLVVRPEQFELHGHPTATDIAGLVVGRSFFGHDGTVRVALDDGTMIVCRTHAGRLPQRGERVGVRVGSPVLAFPATP